MNLTLLVDTLHLNRREDDIKLFNKRVVQIKIKQNNGGLRIEEFLIKESIHGPIIREDGKYAYALRVVGQDQPFVFEQYFDMALSKNFDQFEKAITSKTKFIAVTQIIKTLPYTFQHFC